jgi:hypothetical protein
LGHVEVGAIRVDITIRHVAVRHVGDSLGPRLSLRCTAPTHTARVHTQAAQHALCCCVL